MLDLPIRRHNERAVWWEGSGRAFYRNEILSTLYRPLPVKNRVRKAHR